MLGRRDYEVFDCFHGDRNVLLVTVFLRSPCSFSYCPVQQICQCDTSQWGISLKIPKNAANALIMLCESSPSLGPAESLLDCRVCIASVIIIAQTICKINTEEIKSVRAKYAPQNKAIKRLLKGTSRTVMSVRHVVLELNEIIQLMH